ncbi:hypothetical protein BpHYR1_018104 [Brachionus plicatilis]|uniref:Uncharacterized protein n=1 Tax=Brachionus plicatilis TaxID=10195 RepID=A0A3M7T1W9_BRAPC|nr:hypothetical protein BpHYR1_018104 [Brachionus plicatilis]
MILLIFLCKLILSHEQSSPVKQLNMSEGATGRVGSLNSDDQVLVMRPPYYIVPIEPEDAQQFARKVRIDLENGDIYINQPLEEPVTFSALSINQGSAITIILNPALAAKTECFNLIDGTRSRSKASKDSDKCFEIDSRIFTNNTCDSKIGVKCLDEPVLSLDQDSFIPGHDVIWHSIGDLMLKVTCFSTDWLINIKLKETNISLVEDKGLVFYLKECERNVEQNSTLTNLVKINKFSLNLKVYLIMLVSVVSFMIGFLLFLVNVAARRISSIGNKSKYPSKSSILSVNTIDTRTSVLIDYFDQSLSNGHLDTNKLILDEKNLASKLQYSTGYLSQMGINVSEDLKDLKERNLLQVISGDGAKSASNEVTELTVKKWCNLLEWNVDFGSFSNVIDEMTSLKK